MTETEMIAELYGAHLASQNALLIVFGAIDLVWIYMAIHWFIGWLNKEPVDDYELKKIQKYL